MWADRLRRPLSLAANSSAPEVTEDEEHDQDDHDHDDNAFNAHGIYLLLLEIHESQRPSVVQEGLL
jgi:hypothetical protein